MCPVNDHDDNNPEEEPEVFSGRVLRAGGWESHLLPYGSFDDVYSNRRLRGINTMRKWKIIKDCSEAWHLFDLAQLHVPPRRLHRDPCSYELRMDPRRCIADALFPRARQVLILVFFQQPAIWYRQRDLHRMSCMGLSGLQREIHNLLGAKLIVAEPVRISSRELFPSMKYRANSEAPLFSALCSLAEVFQYSAYVPTCQYPPDTYYRARAEVRLREL